MRMLYETIVDADFCLKVLPCFDILTQSCRMESLSIESCRGLKSVALGTGLQSCKLQLPEGPDFFAKKLPDVDIINLCHLGGGAKGLVISDLLFTQNQDLEAVWIHPTL
jgi:hypothetical protein